MIFITGAGGKTGRALIKMLSEVESICALIHREEQRTILQSLGADKIVLGDIRDDDAIRYGLQGARAVYHICPNMSPDEVFIGKLVIDEARNAGVEHFVYHSVLHPQTEKMMHHWRKLRVEEMIFEAGLPFTILQPAPYMQNLLASWGTILRDGVLRVPYSVDSKLSFVDLEDVAEAARTVLTGANHKNATYELAGTVPMSHIEVADILSHVLNTTVRPEKEEMGDWSLRAEQNPGISGFAVEDLIKMFDYYDQCGLAGNPNVLWWLLKREPTSLAAFVQRIGKEHDAIH